MNKDFNAVLANISPISRRTIYGHYVRPITIDEQRGRACFVVKATLFGDISSDQERLKNALKTVYSKEFVIFLVSAKQVKKTAVPLLPIK
jgi:hypothetical protein